MITQEQRRQIRRLKILARAEKPDLSMNQPEEVDNKKQLPNVFERFRENQKKQKNESKIIFASKLLGPCLLIPAYVFQNGFIPIFISIFILFAFLKINQQSSSQDATKKSNLQSGLQKINALFNLKNYLNIVMNVLAGYLLGALMVTSFFYFVQQGIKGEL